MTPRIASNSFNFMLVDVRIKLTHPFLGQQTTKEGTRRFRKTESGKIRFDESQWSFAVEEAMRELGLTFNPDAIRVPEEYPAPRIDLYVRKWRDASGPQSQNFECIRTGAEISFSLLLMTRSELSDKEGPSLEELAHVLKFIGKWIGLSPWGSKFKYGRFKVLKVEKNGTLHNLGRELGAASPDPPEGGRTPDVQRA